MQSIAFIIDTPNVAVNAYTVSQKKGCCRISAIILPNLNGFQNIFTARKRMKFSTKPL